MSNTEQEKIVMPVLTKLIFGVRTTTLTKLTVTGQPNAPAPSLLIRSSGSSGTDSKIECQNNTWATELVPGDHVIRIELTDAPSFDGKVTFKLDPSSIIVALHSEDLIAWQAVDGSGDTKNPWPPPDSPIALDNAKWFTDTLRELSANIDKTVRIGPSGGPPPHRAVVDRAH